MRVALCLVILLAGCVDTDGSGTDDPVTDPVPSEPRWVTLYLDASGGLSDAVGTDTERTLGWGYQQWLDGTPAPGWSGGTIGPLRIIEGNVTLFFEATQPTLSGDVRPELTAWWGTDKSLYDHMFIDGPDALQPGQVVEAHHALRIPAGGLVMGPDDVPFIRVGTYYADGPDIGAVDLLMGGATASRMTLLVEPLSWPETRSERIIDTTATLLGGRCAVGVNPTEEADSYHTVEVNDTMLGFAVDVKVLESDTTYDIDLVVYSPNGTDIGGGHSSYGVEGSRVWWPNLAVDGPGTYSIRVLACTPQQSTYGISVDAYFPA